MKEVYNAIVRFIRELYSEPEAFIPLHASVLLVMKKKYLNECIETTFVSSVGNFVDQFELETVPNGVFEVE